jgi:uridine phosphorylase
VRIGTCSAIADGVRLADTIAVQDVLGADGTSRSLGAGERITADGALAAALGPLADHAGTVVSTDLFYDDGGAGLRNGWAADGALAVDLQTAAVLAVARRRGVQAGAILAVAQRGDDRLGDDTSAAVAAQAARAALTALAGLSPA